MNNNNKKNKLKKQKTKHKIFVLLKRDCAKRNVFV